MYKYKHENQFSKRVKTDLQEGVLESIESALSKTTSSFQWRQPHDPWGSLVPTPIHARMTQRARNPAWYVDKMEDPFLEKSWCYPP